MSVDGFIAGPHDDLSFLHMVEQPGEDYGYTEFIAGVDTVLMGRKTYDVVQSFGIDFPHRERECYVFSHTRSGSEGQLHFTNEAPASLVKRLRQQDGRTIFVDGGAELVQELLRNDCIDRMLISTIPCILSNGTRLFGDLPQPMNFELKSIKPFASSLVQLEYLRKKDQSNAEL